MRRLIVLFTVFILFAAACGDDDTDEASSSDDTTTSSDDTAGTEDGEDGDGDYTTLNVPDDYATIQEAVDAAEPGDLVLISPGTYHEAVIVQTEDIVIRGTDRNEVILDGEHDENFENGIIVFSGGVAVENLTAHSYTSNGVFFTGGEYDGEGSFLQNYRASYITAYNNGQYGVYAFNAQGGTIGNSYGSGHPDSAFYIGQCFPCNSVIDNVLGEQNALGYSGTNAGGDLYVINSEWRDNRVGLVPNSLDSEALSPQHEGTFVGNYIHDNGNAETPRKGEEWDLAFGVGLVIAGGNDNIIERNRSENNFFAGIAVSIYPEGDNIWPVAGNEVRDNVLSGNAVDLGFIMLSGEEGPLGNCFENNTFETSDPADIEMVAACGSTEAFTPGAIPDLVSHEPVPYAEMPVPGPQATMPDAETAPAVPATAPTFPDIASITVPDAS
jgi:hypothetical protein